MAKKIKLNGNVFRVTEVAAITEIRYIGEKGGLPYYGFSVVLNSGKEFASRTAEAKTFLENKRDKIIKKVFG